MINVVTFEKTLALAVAAMQEERKVIIEDIEGMKSGDLYDSFGCGYDNALDDVIAMIAAKNEEN
jgi:hypothetical protein